jgi:hypothetical protein
MLYYSIGELIDRLAITSLKHWHLEEELVQPDLSIERRHEITQQVLGLNKFRNKLVDSINEFFGVQKEQSD